MDRTALARATESTDAPTPGYLYLDIAKNAASSPCAAREIVQYLTKRLQNKNHNVKYKSLKVLSKTSQSQATRGQFKREVCQDPGAVMAIKDCINFHGPPDPLRGDEIYERVRAAAKECLDAIYSDTPSSDDAAGAGMGGRTASYGNSRYGSSAPSGAYGGMGGGGGGYGGSSSYGGSAGGGGGGMGGKMQGIGNPMFPDPRMDPGKDKTLGDMTIGEVAKNATETIKGMIRDPLARNIPGMGRDRDRDSMPVPGGSGMQGFGSGSYNNPPGRNQLAATTGGQWTMASNRGPNAITPPRNFNSDRDGAYFKAQNASSNAYDWAKGDGGGGHRGGVGGSWASSNTTSVASQARTNDRPPNFAPPHHNGGSTVGGSGGTAVSDGSYERTLIQELCPPGGMRAEPPADKLESFSRSVGSLDPDLVCPALLDALEDGQPWIVKAKALCVMERTLQVTGTDDGNAYADFFHACVAEIEPLGTHSRAAVREPAKRVLKILGVEVPKAPSSDAASSRKGLPPLPSAAAAPEPQQNGGADADLLDFGSSDPPAPVAAPPAAAPPEIPSQPPTTADKGGDASSSLFGGLTVQPTPAAATAEPVNDVDKVNLLDDTSPKDVKQAGGLFSDMSIKGGNTSDASSAKAPDEVSAAAVPGVSGFSFIKEATVDSAASSVTQPVAPAATEVPREEPPAPPPAPMASPGSSGKASFDPLLSLDWGPQSDAAALAQTQAQKLAQMQAMAAASYHQQNMMMMQQMQMRNLMMQQQSQQVGAAPTRHSFSGQPVQGVHPPVSPQTAANGNVMKANSMRQIPLMPGANAGASVGVGSFSFLSDDSINKKKEKEQKSFDFVKDAMKSAK